VWGEGICGFHPNYPAKCGTLKSLVPRQDLVEPKFSPKEYVERVFSENPVEKSSLEDCPSTKSDEEEIKESKRRQRGKANKGLVSTTDPDASVYQRPGIPYQLAYKKLVAVDSKARVITAVRVTPAPHSAGMIEYYLI